MWRSLSDRTVLNNGVSLPWLGLGLDGIADGAPLRAAVEAALEAGCRSFDGIEPGGERDLGRALRASGIARGELVIASAIRNSAQGYAQTLEAVDRTLERLGLEYLDLCLVHGPVSGPFHRTWQAVEELYCERRVRAIGVVDFSPHQLAALLARGSVRPALNQVEVSPRRAQRALQRHCAAGNIQLQARTPGAQGQASRDPALAAIARRRGRSPDQIALRWLLQRDLPALVPATDATHLARSLDVFSFRLTPEELAQIDALDFGFLPNPDSIPRDIASGKTRERPGLSAVA